MTQTLNSRSFWQTGALSDSKKSGKGPKPFRRQALFAFVTLIVISLTLLQKFVAPLNVGSIGGPVEVALPLTYLGLIALAVFVKLKIDPVRLALLGVTLLLGGISTSLQTGPYSTSSVILVCAIYFPFILYVEVSEKTYRKLIEIYLVTMIVVGIIVLLQQIIQLIWTWRVWPNLDSLIPDNLLLSGYTYIQPLKIGSRFMKPNGVFFLEVSAVSQWTAIALALELVYFQRLWRMAFYAVVLIACFAGTGLLLLLITAPVLLTRLSRRSLAVVGLVFGAFVVTALVINWFPQIQHRLTEIQQYDSSSYHRFVAPFQMLYDMGRRPSSMFVGAGPGNIPQENGDVWWAVTKISYEYGILTAVAFFSFIGYVLFKTPMSKRIAFVLLIFYNFSGGFIIPVYPLLVFLIGGLFRLRAPQTARSEAAPSHADLFAPSRAASRTSRAPSKLALGS